MAPATDDADLPDSDVSERHRIADARIGQVVAGTEGGHNPADVPALDRCRCYLTAPAPATSAVVI